MIKINEEKKSAEPIKVKDSKLEKTLKLSSDELIARAISDLLKRDKL